MLNNFSVLHRNLARAYWHALSDADSAVREYEKALEIDPGDYKLCSETDELYALGDLNEKRRKLIEGLPRELLKNDIVAERAAAFYTDAGEYDRALDVLRRTKFYPWEAYTEGRRIYVDANIGKGISLMKEGKYKEAIESFEEVMRYPRNIGVGEPAKKGHAEVLYRMGIAFEKLGDCKSARSFLKEASEEEHPEGSPLSYYMARALQKLGKEEEAESILDGLLSFAENNIKKGLGSEAENFFLMGLAFKGKGKRIRATEYFRRALAANYSHWRSRWELDGFSGE